MMATNARVGKALATLHGFSYILIFIADKSERATEEESPEYDLHVFPGSQQRKS